MNEDFVQYLWKYRKIDFSKLKTTAEEVLIVHHVGEHNVEKSGPDFFNAQITIGKQKWAGNVEVHISGNDWYVHHHELDSAYDNVILHVVWEDDVAIFRKDGSKIPTVQLKDFVDVRLLESYHRLFAKKDKNWINCQGQIANVSDFIFQNWKERLYIERLENKSKQIYQLLEDTANDWEAVLFCLLSKSFGLKVNGEAFLSLARSIDFSVVRKCSEDIQKMEALLLGQIELLKEDCVEPYAIELKKEYDFLKNKFQLSDLGVLPVQFFRVRPPNFPTIRLSQLASLYSENKNLFHKIINTNDLEAFYKLFQVGVSPFWETHFTFDKKQSRTRKIVTKPFIDLILINAIIPIKFVHAKSIGKNPEDFILPLISQLKAEKNTIVQHFSNLDVSVSNALDSQSLLQLKNQYCQKNKCLQCVVGNNLLSNSM